MASGQWQELRVENVDDSRLKEFIGFYRKGPQTSEPNAPCTGATEMNQNP